MREIHDLCVFAPLRCFLPQAAGSLREIYYRACGGNGVESGSAQALR